MGCGTGVWCEEVADENPGIAKYLGSPIQPDYVSYEMEFIMMKFPGDLKGEFDDGS